MYTNPTVIMAFPSKSLESSDLHAVSLNSPRGREEYKNQVLKWYTVSYNPTNAEEITRWPLMHQRFPVRIGKNQDKMLLNFKEIQEMRERLVWIPRA
jgi:hypothetical protein